MPWLAADPVIVLPAQRGTLEALVRAHSTSQQLALRARMILHAADNIGVRESARELDVWPKTVRYWRKRWREALDGQSVPERLCDAPRSGAPATYTPEQICAVIAMTCPLVTGICRMPSAVNVVLLARASSEVLKSVETPPDGALLCQSVPLLVRTFPDVPGSGKDG